MTETAYWVYYLGIIPDSTIRVLQLSSVYDGGQVHV